MIKLGIDKLVASPKILKGKRVGLIANGGSINGNYVSSVDLLNNHSDIDLMCIFGPQQGFWGEQQANMIEWESNKFPKYDLPLYSLYGEHRKPTPEMLSDVDILVFDVQDVGTRIYTYIWTMALSMQACAELNKEFIVCDRPNPINGSEFEGNISMPEFSSFVGLYPILLRHGMTAGEIASYLNLQFNIGCNLTVIPMEGWNRSMWYDETKLPWVIPSFNIPTLDSATVFPGIVAFEGTNISEGRGTTKPFELIGAPYIDGFDLADELSGYNLPGVFFRPLVFIPTFDKHKGENCGGIQIHVSDRNEFKPVKTGFAVLKTIHDMYPDEFEWLEPPYEYVYDKPRIDVILACDWIRKDIEANQSLDAIMKQCEEETKSFAPIRKEYLLY